MLLQTLIGLTPIALPPLAFQPQAPLATAPMGAIQEEAVLETEAKSLAWAAPEDCFIALRLNNPAGMVARSEDSQWLSYLTDARWAEVIQSFAETSEGVEQDIDMEALGAAMKTMVSGTTEIVAWMSGDPYSEEFQVAILAQGTDESLTALAEVAIPTDSYVESDGHSIGNANDMWFCKDGDVALYLISDAGEAEVAVESVTTILESYKSAESPAGAFAEADLQSERGECDVEGVVLLADIMDMVIAEDGGDEIPPSFVEELQGLEWIYINGQIGTGPNSDWTVTMSMLEGGYFASMLESVKPLSENDFLRIPKDVQSFYAFHFGMTELMDVILEIVADIEPGATDEFDSTVDAFHDQTGVHLIDDIIENFSGPVFQFVHDFGALADNPMASMGTMIADLEDPVAMSDALSVLMEMAVGFVGEDVIQESEEDWGTLWSIDFMGIFSAAVAVDRSSFIITAEEDFLDTYQKQLVESSRESSVLSNPGIQKLLEAFDGDFVGGQQISATFEAMNLVIESDPTMADDEDMGAFFDAMEAAGEFAIDHLNGWLGYSWEIESDRFRFITRTR